jgi:hypothetical protein
MGAGRSVYPRRRSAPLEGILRVCSPARRLELRGQRGEALCGVLDRAAGGRSGGSHLVYNYCETDGKERPERTNKPAYDGGRYASRNPYQRYT